MRVSRNFNAKLPSRIEVAVTHNSAEICPRLSHRVIAPLNQLRAKQAPNLQSVRVIKAKIKKDMNSAENVRVERVLFRGQA